MSSDEDEDVDNEPISLPTQTIDMYEDDVEDDIDEATLGEPAPLPLLPGPTAARPRPQPLRPLTHHAFSPHCILSAVHTPPLPGAWQFRTTSGRGSTARSSSPSE